MDEPALNFDGVKLSPHKEIVRAFYEDLWDRADKSLIPKLLHPDLTFRGSLGPTRVGHEGFADYVDLVTGGFEHFTSDILALVEEGRRVCCRLRFHGIHRGEVFGVPPSGRHVWWHGMAMFTFEDARVRDLFVLGDMPGLMARLKDEAP